MLSTTLPDQGSTIHSTYHGHQGLDTLVVHLALLPEGPRRDTARHPYEDLPVSFARHRCLLDHLAQVRELIEEVKSAPVIIGVRDDTLTAAAR